MVSRTARSIDLAVGQIGLARAQRGGATDRRARAGSHRCSRESFRKGAAAERLRKGAARGCLPGSRAAWDQGAARAAAREIASSECDRLIRPTAVVDLARDVAIFPVEIAERFTCGGAAHGLRQHLVERATNHAVQLIAEIERRALTQALYGSEQSPRAPARGLRGSVDLGSAHPF